MKANNTRIRTKEIAFQLFKAGVRPSINKIREQLDGKGGQAAIQESLDEWWLKLSNKYHHYSGREAIPDEAFEFIDKLWSMLTEKSQQNFQAERNEIQKQSQQLQQSLDTETKQRHHVEESLTQYQKKLQYSETTQKTLQQQLEKNRQENNQYQKDLSLSTVKNQQQQQQLTQIQTLFQQLQNEKQTLIKNHENRVLKLENQLNYQQHQYNDKISLIQMEVTDLKLAYQAIQQNNLKLEQNLSRDQAENTLLQQDLALSNNQFLTLEKTQQETQQQLAQQQHKTQHQQQQINIYLNDIKQLSNENQLFITQIQQLSQQISKMKTTEELIRQFESKLKNPSNNV